RSGVLERPIGSDVVRLDGDRVRVVKLARVDSPLGLGELAELVKRCRNYLLLRVVSEYRGRHGGVGDPDSGATREGADQTVELLDEVRRARLRRGRQGQGDDEADGESETDPAHPAGVTAGGCACFTV